MLDFGFYNEDCMKGMKEFPDKYFDLAIVDPPYGIDIGNAALGVGGGIAPHRNRSARQSRSAGQHRSEANPSGGDSACRPKFTRHLMTATHRMPLISKNLTEWQRTRLYSAGITFLII